MGEPFCLVCLRRKPDRGLACTPCRDRMSDQLTDLPRKVRDLRVQVVPSPAGLRPRVQQSRTAAPIPVRLDALSLTGPGSGELSDAVAMHPMIRRWPTQRTVTVTDRAGRTTEETITVWETRYAVDVAGQPVWLDDGDQHGIIPPADWLDLWVGRWRKRLGHHQPLPRRDTETPPREQQPAATPSRNRTRELLGLADGYGGRRFRAGHGRDEPAEDPTALEWQLRYPTPSTGTVNVHVGYLLTWLDHACDDNPRIGEFGSELRALSAELSRVLGEQPDQQWLGCCPNTLTDRTATPPQSVPCGAGLWQDPHASVVTCPRCRAAWGPRKADMFTLAAEIRRVWPIDRRRRYADSERRELDGRPTDQAPVRCPGCGRPATIKWSDVTATTDRERWWRPDRATCPAGCTEKIEL
jgi:hypothetical protein